MDEMKLFKWMVEFQRDAKKLSIEYDSLFLDKTFEESYELQLNSTSQELIVVIADHMPTEIRDRLLKTLVKTKPEDSV